MMIELISILDLFCYYMRWLPSIASTYNDVQKLDVHPNDRRAIPIDPELSFTTINGHDTTT